MRRLIVKNRGASPKRGAKLFLYLEDPRCEDLVYDGIKMRSVGVLGKKTSFETDEQSRRLFVFEGEIGGGRLVGIHCVAEGTEELTICGRLSPNGVSGAVFSFDGDEGLDAIKRRDDKKLVIIITAAVIASALFMLAALAAGARTLPLMIIMRIMA